MYKKHAHKEGSRLSREERAADILKHARILFCEKGYSDTLVSEIAERVNLRIAGDFFNAWNHHQYNIGTGALIGSGSGGGSSIDNGVSDTTAGQITNAAAARIIQISGKLTF